MGIVSRFTAAFLLVALSVSFNLPDAWGQDETNRPAASRLQQLLNRRLDELRKADQLITIQHASGVVDYGTVLSVQMKLREAELEAAETPEARLAVLTAYLKTAKMVADYAEERGRNGTVSKVDSLIAQATATGIEIKVLKARAAMGLGEE